MAAAEKWVAELAFQLGVAAPSEAEMTHILDLARVAAHQSERRAAPLACWLAASAGLSPEQGLAVAESLQVPATED